MMIAAATIPLLGFPGGESFGEVVIVGDGGVESNTTPATYDALEVRGTDGEGHRSTYSAEATLTLTEDLRVHDAGVFHARADVDCGFGVSVYRGGTLILHAGTLTAPLLNFDGPEALTRAGGTYATDVLGLASGASLTYAPDDGIFYDVSLTTGASLTLARDLTTVGHVTIDGASTSLVSAGHAITTGYLDIGNRAVLRIDQPLSLSSGAFYLFSGGSIIRGTETVSAPSFFVDDATFDLLAGDSFASTEASTISAGAIVNAPAGTALGLVNVSGTNGNGDRATFNVHGDTTVTSASIASDGVINLIAGTLTTPSLSLVGAASAGRAGGHYDVASLSLSAGATLSSLAGDTIDALSISDAGSRLDELAPLTLTSLSLSSGGILHLGAFTGSGAVSHWAMRMAGDDKTFLENLILAGLITDGTSTLQVVFDPGSNMTYVTATPSAVPEIDPTTTHGAVMLLVGACGLLERRLRCGKRERRSASPRSVGYPRGESNSRPEDSAMRSRAFFRSALGMLLALVVASSAGLAAAADTTGPVATTERDGVRFADARSLGIEGQGWPAAEFAAPFDRLPAKAQEKVRADVWNLSRHTAGLCVRFLADTPAIHARWTLTSPQLAMRHMPATGVSGLDLYARDDAGAWRWVACASPNAEGADQGGAVVDGLAPGKREWLLYLPLYNGVASLEIGVPAGATLERAPATLRGRDKPIVFYGTSITHGACASRPGACHTAILQRRYGRPVVNLGFSGNGRMEPEVGELLAEIDAAAYVIDCCPNLDGATTAARTRPLVELLRTARPDTPIILVEDRRYTDSWIRPSKQSHNDANHAALKAAYDELVAAGVPGLHYLGGDDLLGADGEGTVDSSHPTDAGFVDHAKAFSKVLDPLFR